MTLLGARPEDQEGKVLTRAEAHPSSRRDELLWAISVVGLLAVSWALTYLLGGTAHVPPHWFYVPIFLAARRFRTPVVLLTAAAAGILAGPLVPADVETELAQPASDWITRAVFFVGLGLFIHGLFRRLQIAYERERREAAQLRAVDEERVRMLTAVSHEVRTPLTAIAGFSETLGSFASSLPPKEIAELALRMNANAQRLMELLASILEVDATGRPDASANREPADLASVARAVLERSDVSGRLTADLGESPVEVDPAQIERVIEILLSNAVQHTEPGVQIWIRTGYDGDSAFLEVADAGPGVTEELRRHIFEPFKQGPSLNPHSPGAGLGLAVAKRLVEANGGTLSVDDRPGGGARFVVKVPVSERTPG